MNYKFDEILFSGFERIEVYWHKKNQKQWTDRLNRQVKKQYWYIPYNLFLLSIITMYWNINILIADNI